MLILGSQSKARYDLLKMYNAQIKVLVANVDETFNQALTTHENVKQVAYQKAMKLLNTNDIDNDILICADTIVLVNDCILQKPIDYDEAFKMIEMLSNNKVEIISGVYLKIKDKIENYYESSYIYFKDISKEKITLYLKENPDYLNISGALDIDKIKAYLDYEIQGSYTNIIGLPMERISKSLCDNTLFNEDIMTYGTCAKIDIYRTSTRAIIKENDEYVLLKAYTFDKQHSYYQSIGGGYHLDEDSIDILKKESIEEGGLIINEIKPLIHIKEYNVSSRNMDYTKLTVHSYYSARVEDYTNTNYIDYEIDLIIGLERFTLDKLIEVLQKQYDKFKDLAYPVKAMTYCDLKAFEYYKGELND